MRRAVARMRSQPSTSQAIIFSQRTCRPASRQATVISACVHSGVAMTTPSSDSFCDHLAPLGVVRGLGVAALLEHRVGLRQLRRVDVGHRDDVGVGLVGGAEQHAALAADADVADAHRAAGDRAAGQRCRAEAGEDGDAGDGAQEVAAAGGLFFGGQVHRSSTSAARAAPNRTVRRSSVVRSTSVSGWVAQ